MLLLLLGLSSAAPVMAQQEGEEAPRRTRVALGPQLVPSYPGADGVSVRPLVDVARGRGDTPFAFEAPDESFGPRLLHGSGLEVGPSLNFEGRRSRSDTDGRLDKVGFTVELGGFVNYQLTPAIRLRTEVRKGLGGHHGWIGVAGADYIARDGDRWLFSLGPRLTLSDGSYNRAYFGVSQTETAMAGLPAYRPDGGLQAVGATAGLVRQFTPRWGVYGYAKYDRLVADPARSPVVREFGSRNQVSGGVALTYTFGRGVP
jgi:MipA family protein